MPDWLKQDIHGQLELSNELLAFRLLGAAVLGVVVAGIYALTQRRPKKEMIPMATTLALMTILIAMVTVVIGNNVARAFSLAGALAIIRFRTVVEDTRDTAFVIFAVVVGMSVGAGMTIVPLVGIPIVAVAAVLFGWWNHAEMPQHHDHQLTMRVAVGKDPESIVQSEFAKHFSTFRLHEAATSRQGSAVDVVYNVNLKKDDDAMTIVGQLNQIDGVQSVELKRK